MFVLPLASIAIEAAIHQASMLWLIGKWFVFWGVGARLLLAGVRQYFQPAFTVCSTFGQPRQDSHIFAVA